MKINYYLMLQDELKKIGDTKPSLLLHVCCGPCSSHVIKELCQYFNITIYYSNSNIYPIEEYQRRFQELLYFIEQFNQDFHQHIQVIEDPYNHSEWISHMYPLKEFPEGSIRCKLCYHLRMRRTFDYAKINHYDYWTTVLSVSPHKNSQWINEIGDSWQKEKPKFLYADFKKNDGYLKSTQMTKQYNMYRQNYCGCMFSYEEMLKRENRK
ncbi:MAG: epoxyqueuosine reductase QueH [Coprobacillus sp.]|nr:epoxyqueuosine reductase QueH [Coprobacillus sp.]